ncbi:twin-arginine translocation signal domain-containing protein [Streptomyces sp. NPDC057746]|uniref:twin-arginine translocation signal domain-containing protein n=1 Tax=Streptomyces sp. NPDC057746 TaxID=3346237 RepID=UPI0036CB653D
MWSTTSRRRFVGAAAIGVALAATSGCTVPDDAVAGIAVTADGHLLGVMMVCGHQIDGATLYVDNDDVNKQVTVGSWTADHPLTQGLATWTLDSPAPGWTATKSLAPLTAKTTYTLYGWTRDNNMVSEQRLLHPGRPGPAHPGKGPPRQHLGQRRRIRDHRFHRGFQSQSLPEHLTLRHLRAGRGAEVVRGYALNLRRPETQDHGLRQEYTCALPGGALNGRSSGARGPGSIPRSR